MSLKKYFAEGYTKNSLPNSGESIREEVESLKYISARNEEKNTFIPHIDFTTASNFARYGSAEKYYEDAFTYIYQEYPYDGSLKERTQWINSLSPIDKYVFDNIYPRTTGYVTVGASYGSAESVVSNYGGVPTASYEYIRINGGPNRFFDPEGDRNLPDAKALITGSGNIYKLDVGRSSNLNLDLGGANSGSTVEFWMKKDEMVASATSKREVIFDLWNSQPTQSVDYGRLTIEMQTEDTSNPIFKVTAQSGSALVGFFEQNIGTVKRSDVINSTNHYAFTFKNEGSHIRTRFYFNGALNEEKNLGTNISPVTGAMVANIGSLVTSPAHSAYAAGTVGTTSMNGWGKLSASLDEFRYWRTERSGKEIRRYYRGQTAGGTNSDNDKHDRFKPVELGVYYKFNEGVTGTSSVDSVLLDYSGRLSNGSWTGYVSTSRNIGSLLDDSGINEQKEYKDPIIYSFHPTVKSKLKEFKDEGRTHDHSNTSLLYNNFPKWMLDEDNEGVLYKLTQIIGSYFDKLHLQIESLPRLKDSKYLSGSFKPYPHGEKLLSSVGVDTPELFVQSKILEIFEQRGEERLYEKDLSELKDLIYQNIYNNLVNIYKSKGTEQSYRNLIRCFGIDNELVRLNVYSDGDVYTFGSNTKGEIIRKTFLDFGGSGSFDSYAATVYLTSSATDTQVSPGYISGTLNPLMDYIPITMECETILPRKETRSTRTGYRQATFLTSSIFGIHLAHPDGDGELDWPNFDEDLRVQVCRSSDGSKNAFFRLTGSLPTSSTTDGIQLSSPIIANAYDEQKWNLAVRFRHENFPYVDGIAGATISDPIRKTYILEFYGVNSEGGEIRQEFFTTASIALSSSVTNFLRKAKRPFIGAHRTNFTGAVLQYSDVKVGSFRFWHNYLDNEVIRRHALDSRNVGTLNPSKNAYFLDGYLNGVNIPETETLVLNWEFQREKGLSSTAGGVITDILDWSSGSNASSGLQNRHKFLGPILKQAHTGRGMGFSGSTSQMFSDEYVYVAAQQPAETINSDNLIKILSKDDEIFTRDSEPVKHVITVEKSMYNTVSEEMLKYFASIKDFNNLVGHPVERYRKEYKKLKNLRHLFFENVENTPDIDKYLDFYKWVDSSILHMIRQMTPVTAEISENFGDVIESHVLERNKFHNKFPTIDTKDPDLAIAIKGAKDLTYNWKRGSAPVPTSPAPKNQNSLWWEKRADRTGSSDTHNISSGDTLVDKSRSAIFSSSLQVLNYQTPYMFSTNNSRVIHGGINYPPSKKTDYILSAVRPHGPKRVITGMLLPDSAMIVLSSSVSASFGKINSSTDFKNDNPNGKQRVSFKALNQAESMGTGDNSFAVGKGETLAPFSLFSSSVTTGYNKLINDNFVPGIDISNLHSDDYGEFKGVPMQGPFTDAHVGGRKHRHVRLNRSASHDFVTINGIDDERTRPEAFRIRLGALGGENGAIGIVGADYPTLDDTFYPDLDTAFSTFYRNSISKRPMNIRNISYNTSSAIIGNYRSNYEVVQTTGRDLNNLYFRKAGGIAVQYAESAYLTGVVDFALPRRDLTGSKSIIVNRFSAPGGFEVNSRGYLDVEAEEYSVYNALPYRNLAVTVPLRELLSRHAGPFGLNWLQSAVGGNFPAAASGGNKLPPFPNPATSFFGESTLSHTYLGDASYHKVNRNRGRRIKISGSTGADRQNAYTTITASQFDNFYVQHPIPRSDLQYSWISSSALSSRYMGHSRKDGIYYTTATGETPAITFVSSSDFKSTISNTGQRVFGAVDAYAEDAANTSRALGTDFVGLNIHIFEPFTSSTNTLGFPAGTALERYINADRSGHTGFIDLAYNLAVAPGTASALNSLLLNRNGPYGYPSWKQIRASENPIIRDQKRKSVFSIEDAPLQAEGVGYRVQSQRGDTVTHFTESAVTFGKKPMAVKIRTNDQDYEFVFSYSNNKEFFKHEQVNLRLTNFNSEFRTKVKNEAYESLKGLIFENDDIALAKITHKENLFPKEQNAGLNKVRFRENYAEIAGTGYDGYDRLPTERRKFWGADNNRGRTSAFTDFTKPNDIAVSGSFLNSMGHKFGSSVWPMEMSVYPTGVVHDDFTNQTLGTVHYDVSAIYGGSAYVTGGLQQVSGGAIGELHMSIAARDQGSDLGGGTSEIETAVILDPNLKGMFGNVNFVHSSNPALFGQELKQAFHFPTASIFFSYLPEMGFSSSAEFIYPYRVIEQSGKKPWYDSYEDYASELRLFGKDYSLLPEFRISDNIDYYLQTAKKKLLGAAASIYRNDKILKLEGATGVTASADIEDLSRGGESLVLSYANGENEEFFKVYSHSDFLRHFGEIQDDFATPLDKITLSCKGIKKILPYNGFYPMTRTTQLAALLSQSVAPFLSGTYYGSKFNSLPHTGSEENPLSGALAVQSLMQPFFAPGMLFNAIKSGIAVDWPAYTGSVKDMGIEQIQTPPLFAISFIATQGSNWRIPFESMADLEFEKSIPEEPVYLFAPDKVQKVSYNGTENPYQRYPYFHLTKDRLSLRKPNFELAMNNFLGEVPRFFLEGGKLNYFKSKKSKNFKPFVVGNTYYMDIKLFKTDNFDMIRSAVSGVVHNSIAAGSGFNIIPTEGNTNNRARSYHGRYFGPPVQYHTNSLGLEVHRGIEYSDPAYAPFTPPYFYGQAKVTISYTATKTNPSVDEIISKAYFTYDNSAFNGSYAGSGSTHGIFKRLQATGTYFPIDFGGANLNAGKTAGQAHTSSVMAASASIMHISSSINFRASKLERKREEITSGGTTTFKFLPGVKGEDDVWVIAPKFECPVLNFSGTADQHPTQYSGGVGIWSTYGKLTNLNEGVFLEVADTYTKGLVAQNTGSLIEQCGFGISPYEKDGKRKRKIGRIAENKQISEAIVAIPFLDKPILEESNEARIGNESLISESFSTVTREEYNGRHFIKINKQVFKTQKKNVLDFNSPALKKGFSFKGKTLDKDIKNTSISEMIKKMDKFVLPPQFDFLNNDAVHPFVMYMFDFTATLNRQDLADIWQGVMPTPRKGNGFLVEKDESKITHGFTEFDFYEGNQNFIFGQKDNKVRWMVFKIKQRAEKFYANISDAQYLDGEEQKKTGTFTDTIHYNWPYDYFSLVELAKIEANLELAPSVESLESLTSDTGEEETSGLALGEVDLFEID